MNIAQPLFAAKIGRRKPHAVGSDNAHSLNTTPIGVLPTSELKLSLPTTRQSELFLQRIIIS